MSAPIEFAFGLKSRRLAEVVEIAREGDRAAFDQLVREMGPAAWGLAIRLTGRRADAEDLVQEAFLKAFRHIGRLREDQSFRGWLFRILLNTWRDQRRRKEPCLTAPTEVGAGEDAALTLARRDLLRRVLLRIDALPRRQREALLLRVRGGLTYREAALTMGIRKGAVKAHLVQARRKLLRRFGKEIEGWT
jgi:RNA polymerase sigma-70 factor, ECF subfamily